jgi:D-alanyl-D-alanine carboxypeptidase
VAEVGSVLARAGAPRTGWDLSDGSGLSIYNRVSPRAMVALLRWASAQNWGEAWRATFPIAGWTARSPAGSAARRSSAACSPRPAR